MGNEKRGSVTTYTNNKTSVRAFLMFCLFFCSTLVQADWKSDANTRIEQIRKRNAQITVVDSIGNPVQDITVQIEQSSHLFAFGTCIRNSKMSDNIYKNFILNHFEWAVCENETKWGSNEGTRDVETYSSADNIYNWCSQNGIKMRGHCLFWEQNNANMPEWLKTLPCAEMPAEVDERIVSAVNHYKGKFYNWDVDNEMLSDDFFGSCLGESGRVHMFQYAKQLDPDCGMFMNEYSGNSFGGYDSGPYVTRYNNLISMGAPIDGLGIQAHLGTDLTFEPQRYYDDVLEPLAVLGKPIWATEFDASHSNVTTSADNIENFFRICFSHSSVEGIILWGFMEGQMWRTNAALVTSSGTLTERGVRYEALMNEWTTEDSNYTDLDGQVNFRGFHGNYDITLSSPGQTTEVHTIQLDPGSTTAEFILQTDLHSPVPDNTPPTPDPMTWSSVPAATGSSTITMTASTATDSGSPPVQYYFECTNDASKSSSWQSSTTYAAQGLTPLTQYTFRVKARDSYLTPNETGWSGTASATTEEPSTDIEILGSWATDLSHAKESGYSRALIFIAHEESVSGDPVLTSVTYGGQAMTKVIERSAVSGSYGNYVAAFILNDTGITAATNTTFAPTWSGSTSTVSYASIFLSNVDQTTSIGASASNSTITSTPNPILTSALATEDGDMVLLGVTCGNNGSYTLNSGFTEGTDQSVGTNGHTGAAGHKSATGISETPSATFSATVNRQTIIGFVVKAAAAVDDPPAAPTGLTATEGNETVSLDWNDNSEPDLDGYNVYRSTTQGSGYSQINLSLVTDSNYVDNNVDNGTPYYYVVTAVDEGTNESGYSNEASATPDFQNCADVHAGGFGYVSDFTGDCYIDMSDLAVMVQYWLHTDCAGLENCDGADLEPDGDVDFIDYSDFVSDWLICNDPQDPSCVKNW